MSCLTIPLRASKPRWPCVQASTRTIATATEIAGAFLARTAGNDNAVIRRQTLDGNQLRLLSMTLNRPQLHQGIPVTDAAPTAGTPLPAGYHLVYFTPAALEEELGSDGTDRSFNPDHPFTRRMWAGGRLIWEKENPLRVGQEVVEKTKVVSAEAKRTKAGEEMIVVGVEKTFSNEGGISLVDERQWLFRPALTTSPPAPPAKPALESLPEASLSRDFTQTAVTLFRFSALTFNAHKIHYSRPWCQRVEGHRDIVVHGPLNLIHFLDLWRDGHDDRPPKSIKYRATSPLYAEEPYRMLIEAGNDGTKLSEGRIVDAAGTVAMTAIFEAFE